MEFIFEFLIEKIMEPIVECYIFLMSHFSEKSKKLNKDKAVYIVVAESLALLLMFVIGGVMLLVTSGESLTGKLLLSFSVAVSIIQITLGLLLRKKKKVKNNIFGGKLMNFPELNLPCMYPTVFFGQYLIPNGCKNKDVYIRYPIEWMVVEQDSVNKKVLLVAKYALEWEGFANCPLIGSFYETSWDKSYSRIWLNGDFYNDSFSDEQKEMIIPTFIEATGGNKERTSDKIFLLSVDEVKKYFPKESNAIALQPMVEKSLAEGTYKDPFEIGCFPAPWWTRTSGETPDRVMCVGPYGNIFDVDSNADELGLRPAMWIKYGSDD